MNKKEIIFPFLFIGLSAAFTFVCLAVYLSNGKSKKWISRKMKIGGLLLTISLFSCSDDRNRVVLHSTCYFTVMDAPVFDIEIDSNRIIYGSMSRLYGDFSYSLVDINGKIIQKNKVFPMRYMSDPENQEFLIEVNHKLNTGKYVLKLYNCELNQQDSTYPIHKHEISIINE